jgi:mandelate racemase
MRRPLRTSAASIASAPLVLIDVETEQGIVGRSYLFAYVDLALPLIRRAIADMDPLLIGSRIEPAEMLRRSAEPFGLFGTAGLLSMALAGLDVAYWDALAHAVGFSLARLLGGSPRDIPAYNSNGLGMMGPDEAAAEALALLGDGFTAIKVRLGRQDRKDDLDVVRAIRKRVPAVTTLMADFNQCLSTSEALSRCRMLDGEGVSWVEEPVAHDDFAGAAKVGAAVDTPVQLGENFTKLGEMQAAIAQGACDLVMPDVARIGGVTGWLKAAAIAEVAGIAMSSHLYPEICSHLLAVTPTAHWIEYVDWATPILAEPVRVENGRITTPDTSGSGLSWNEDAVAHYAIV